MTRESLFSKLKMPLLLALGFALCVAAPAMAQPAPTAQATPVRTEAAPAEPEATAVVDLPTHTVRPAWWELIGGFEGDTHQTGYGFLGPAYIHPLSQNLALHFHLFGNYLFYEFTNDLGGRT